MMTLEPDAPQSIPVVILTLDTTTRAGSCAVWRGDGMVDEVVGNPEKTHAQRLPNDLATLLAHHRLKLKDVTLQPLLEAFARAVEPAAYSDAAA